MYYIHFVCRTLQQAASVPVVYATAYYSLVVRGRLRNGETVLIHSGSGGVGQAAIAIALSMQCKVFTTVGSYETPSWELKVSHVTTLKPCFLSGCLICGAYRLGREAGLPDAKIPTAVGRLLCQLQRHNF